MTISSNVKAIISKSSWIRKMFEEGQALAQQVGAENVCDMSLGNPTIEPPTDIKKALIQLLQSSKTGQHQYMPNPGIIETRQYLAEQLSNEHNLPFTFNDITMTVGAAGALLDTDEDISGHLPAHHDRVARLATEGEGVQSECTAHHAADAAAREARHIRRRAGELNGFKRTQLPGVAVKE